MSSAPEPLSNIDAASLDRYGLDITEGSVGVMIETALVAFYCVIFAFSLYSFLRKGIKSRTVFIMLCMVIYLFASALVMWVLDVFTYFTTVHALLRHGNMPLPDRAALAAAETATLSTPQMAFFWINMIIGDTIVIWRVWVIYFRTRWIILLPCILLFASIFFAVFDLLCLSGSGLVIHTVLAGGQQVCQRVEVVPWTLSLATNALCTVLIGFKFWEHRRVICGLHLSRSITNQILSLLVESGFIYCLLWLLQVACFFDVPRDSRAGYLIKFASGLGKQLSGMYPTLIITIVNLRYTIQWENSESISLNISAGHRSSGNVSTLRWAAPPTQLVHTQHSATDGQVNGSEMIVESIRKSAGDWKETTEHVV
ncbi:hypothetical protein B0H19DRAFT_1029182 [Mycena capillaripes]|nr:hypothetical protein B0H19DRAFT_1029182 [Mycena capillaripes]